MKAYKGSMAEVKTGNGIPSLPLKKPPSFCHPSSSYKHIYDDIFASPHQSRQQSSTFIDDDYAEMFGSSRTNNGTWSISYSSIPVLDLPPPSEMRVRGASGVTTVSGERGGKVDYGGVFGGFGDGKFNLPDGEDLFHQFNKKNEASSNAIPRSQVQTKKATRPEISRQSLNDRSPSNTFSQSIDSFQNSEQKKNEAMMKTSGEIRNTAQVHEIPGAIHKMEEAVPVEIALPRKLPVIKDDTQLSKDVNLTKQQGKHDRYISMDLSPIVQNNNSVFLKESGFSASSSVHISQDTSQSATTPTKVFSESIDSLEDFEQKQNEVTMKNSGEIRNTAHVRDLPGAIHKMEEAVPVEIALPWKLPVIKDDTQRSKDVNLTKQQGKHDRYISMDLSPIVQNNNSGFFKESSFSASSSVHISQDTSQSATTPTKVFSESIDSLEDFEQKQNEVTMKKSGEIRNTAHVRDLPGAIHKMQEAVPVQTTLSGKLPVIKDDTQQSKDVNITKRHGKHDRYISMDLSPIVQNNNSGFLKEPVYNASSSVDTSHDTSQSETTSTKAFSPPSEGSSNSFSQPSDDMKHFDHMNHEMHNTDTSEPIFGADVHAIHESTSTLHEIDLVHLSSEKSVVKDNTETQKDVDMAEKQGRQSRNFRSELKTSKHNNELDAVFQKEERKPFSLDASLDTRQPSLEAGMSKKVDDNIAINFDIRRKKGRHSRITSLDLGAHKQSFEEDGKLHRKPRFGGSYSFDASNDPQAASVKMQPSMMAPSSSVPQFFPVESHYKISENSSWRNIGTRVYRGGSVSPPSLDEQLDMNSIAARSAAALQRAIEEASMIIQMAKEYLEREGQGSSVVRFKDTLKVIVAKDRQLEDEMDKFEERLSVLEDPVYEKPEKVLKDLPVVHNQKKFVKDEGCMEETIVHDNSPPAAFGEKRFSLPERISIVENPAKSLKGDHIFQDGKKFFEDEGRIEERNADMSRMSDERDTQEGGGEWEAAKSLNQLICGVKNKIASFMAWQTDIEKKEDPKETPDLLGVENSEITTAEINVDDPGCPGEHVEIEIGFLSETVDSCEDESLWSNTAGQEKADSSVDLSPVVAAAPSENFMFFPFRNEAAHIPTDRTEEEKTEFVKSTDIEFMNAREEVLNGPTDTNEEKHTGSMECSDIELMDVREEVLNEPTGTDEGNTGSLECTDIEFTNVREEVLDGATDTCEEKDTGAVVECTDIEFKNVREEVLNEVKYEQLNGKSEEQNHEVLDNTCSDRDSVDSNIEETAEVMESSSMVGNGRNEPTDDENLKSSHDEECRQDLIPDSHCPESTTEEIDEYVNSKVYEVTKETENWQHDAQILEEIVLGATEGTHDYQEIERDESEANHIEKAAVQMHGCEATHGYQAIEKGESQANHIEEAAVQMHGFDEYMTADTVTDRKGIIEEVAEKASLTGKDFYEETGSSFIDEITEEMAKEASTVTTNEDEHSQPENEYREEKTEQVTENEHIEDKSEQVFESASLNEAVESCKNDDTSARVEEAASSDEECDGKMENVNPFLEPNLRTEETMLFYDSFVDLDGITDDDEGDDDDEALPAENYDVYSVKKKTFVNDMEVESQDILENQTKPMHDFKEIENVTEVNSISGPEAEKCGGDAVQRRRRWFDNGAAERPSILEGDITEMEINQEALDESILAGSVEIHAHELNSHKQEVTYSKDTVPTVNHDSGNVNCESTPKRRRWSVKIGDEGLPVPPPLFQDINVNLDEPQNTLHETLLHSKSESSLDKLNAKSDGSLNGIEGDVAVNGIKDKKSIEAPSRRRRWFGSGENVGLFSQLGNSEDSGIALGIDQKSKGKDMETGLETGKMEPVNDIHLDEVKRKEKEKEKERIAVERAIREARERAFVEARERARRDASERPNVEARPKVATGAQERVGKVHAEARGPSDKAAVDARLRNERAAVERATQEARERALQKALSEKASHRSREQKFTSSDPNFQSSSSSSRADSSNKSEKYDGFDSESAQRRRVRLEKQSRTMERPVIVLDEKNQHDLLVQKEEAAKKMMADSLDAEVKRWSAGKEGNLRIMLSTLQYILGPESGWQPVSLTDLIASTAVRKAYKKATLCVHPDKLQQRGASIQQKYICDKVFDLLKDAWSKLTPDER